MVLLTSQTITASTTYPGVHIGAEFSWFAEFQLSVTAAATAAGDTLNVYVQSSCDNGTTFDDLVSFTQVLGNGGAKKFLARWQGSSAPSAAMAAPQDAALAAGQVKQGPTGTFWRVKAVVVSASAPSFTFSVYVSGDIIRHS